MMFPPCCERARRFTKLSDEGVWTSDGDQVFYCCCCGSRLPDIARTDSGFQIVGPGLFYIQDSRQYVGNDVSWWRPNSGGYTCQIDEAGLYDEAFCRGARDTDIIWRWEDIYPLATRVVDIQRMRNIEAVIFPPAWAARRPDLVALWRVVETGKGTAAVPECVARHMLSYRNWKPGDGAIVRHGIVRNTGSGGWSCAAEVMLDCIEKAVASG